LNPLQDVRKLLEALSVDAVVLSSTELSVVAGAYLTSSILVISRSRVLLLSETPIDIDIGADRVVVSPYMISVDKYVIADTVYDALVPALRGVLEPGAAVGLDALSWPSRIVKAIERRWRVVDVSSSLRRILIERMNIDEARSLFIDACRACLERRELSTLDALHEERAFVGVWIVTAYRNGYSAIVARPTNRELENAIKTLSAKRLSNALDLVEAASQLAKSRGMKILGMRAVVPLTTLYRDTHSLSISRAVNLIAIESGSAASCLATFVGDRPEIVCCGDVYG